MFCSHCGKSVTASAKFCPFCGTLTNTPHASQANTTTSTGTHPTYPSQPNVPPAYVPPEYAPVQMKASAVKRPNAVSLIGVAAFFCIDVPTLFHSFCHGNDTERCFCELLFLGESNMDDDHYLSCVCLSLFFCKLLKRLSPPLLWLPLFHLSVYLFLSA